MCVIQHVLKFAQWIVFTDPKIPKALALKRRLMDLILMRNSFILILRSASIVAHANLSVPLKPYLRKVRFLRNGQNILRSTISFLGKNPSKESNQFINGCSLFGQPFFMFGKSSVKSSVIY